MKKENIAYIQLMMCPLLFSTSGFFLAYIPWNSMLISAARSTVMAIALLIFFKVTDKKITINKKSIRAGLFMFATITFFMLSTGFTSVTNSTMLEYTAPIHMIILSVIFFKRKIRRRDMLAVVFVSIGIFLFFCEQITFDGMLGNFLGLMAGVSYAMMFLTNEYTSEEERFSAQLIAQILAIIVAIPVLAVTGAPELSTEIALMALGLGLVQYTMPYMLYAMAAGKCKALACCMIGSVEPLLTPVWVFVATGILPSMLAIIGGILVVGTILIWSVIDAKREACME